MRHENIYGFLLRIYVSALFSHEEIVVCGEVVAFSNSKVCKVRLSI